MILPWIGIVALLLIPGNRSRQALWVFAPLILLVILARPLISILPDAPSDTADQIWQATLGAAFGIAAVWLMSVHLEWRNRFAGFFACACIAAFVGLITVFLRQLQDDLSIQTLPQLVLVSFWALAAILALAATSLICRGRDGWLRMSVVLLLSAVVVSLLICAVPVIGAMLAGNTIPFTDLLLALSIVAVAVWGILMPFVVLSFTNKFYRERFYGLMHIGRLATPPMVHSAPPPQPANA